MRARTHTGTYRMTVELDDGGGADLRNLVDASVVEGLPGTGTPLPHGSTRPRKPAPTWWPERTSRRATRHRALVEVPFTRSGHGSHTLSGSFPRAWPSQRLQAANSADTGTDEADHRAGEREQHQIDVALRAEHIGGYDRGRGKGQEGKCPKAPAGSRSCR